MAVITVPSRAAAVAGGGTGTTNTVPRFSSGLLADSGITDDGSTIALGRNTVQLNTGTSLNFGSTLARISSPADKQILIRGGSGGAGTDNRLYFGGTGSGNAYILQNGTDFVFRSSTTDAPTGCSMGQISVGNTTFRAIQGNAAGAGVSLGQTGQYVFTNNNLGSGGSMDTGLARDAAGIIRVTNASTGVGALRTKRGFQTTAGPTLTLTDVQSGDFVTTTGTTTITLPTPTAGITFWIMANSAHVVTVTTPSGVIRSAAGDLGASAISSGARGEAILLCADGTDYQAITTGTWT